MPSLNFASRSFTLAGFVFLALASFTPSRVGAEPIDEDAVWLWQPWISTASGYDSDLILDPDFTRQVVPGGGYSELSPGFRLSRRLSQRSVFRILNRNTVERFFNPEKRTLFASSLVGDFRLKGRSPLQGRVTLNGDYFNDSGSASFRRLSGGVEVGVGAHLSRWELEVSGYVLGRRYPNVLVPAVTVQAQTYTEDHRGLAGYLIWNPSSGLYLKGALNRRLTNAADPAFESTSWTASGNINFRLMSGSWVSANIASQSRVFSNRTAAVDHDSYVQVGIGLSRELTSRVNLLLRYSHAAYTYPLGGQQEADRFSAGINWQFGAASPVSRRIDISRRNDIRGVYTVGTPVPFRIHAPGAESVVLVGSFNNWSPSANPLQMTEQGWWETSLELGPGTFEYLYLIDGEASVPADTDRTVADGFGGYTGVLRILPARR